MSTVIYPRGFLGYDVGVVQEKSKVKEFLQTIRGLEFNRPVTPKINTFPPNPDVDRIWTEYLNGSNHTSSFAFRERILVTAFRVFKTNSFYDWCNLQNNSPYTNSVHKKFLEDTFQFIKTGKRGVNVSTWIGIVKIDPENNSTRNTSIDLSGFFGLNRAQSDRTSFTTIDTINSWVSHPGGFDDLLACLVIFFGSID